MLHTNCFPDLTADICPRDRYDPIDDQHIRKMAKMRPCKPLASNWTPPARSPSLLPQCPLQCKLPILRLLQAWPSLPSLLASRTPTPSNSTTGEPITCTSRAIPVSTFLYNLSSAVLQHPGLDLNSWDQSIHAFFFCNTHPLAGGAARVALEIHRRAGVLSGCSFITDIRMSGTSDSPSTAGLCAADSLELKRGDKIKGSTGAPCI
ncbi:hypothetical protein NA56DRAFT_464449 [Hyaloscypha hepaticicola]|uniref:Uncharacterized protein n=1 Tax=Hyaloscypha hepaticicola TaxID=2082293 RepID=A0A2J6QFE4_9HELO|nr:hypothetical protein NA56DRAFT_464449 [Hyaloscypha hepaticicola]